MRRSKLEMYVDILKVLAQRGPLKLTHVMYKANVNCSVLKGILGLSDKAGPSRREDCRKTPSGLRSHATRHYSAEVLQRTKASATDNRRGQKPSANTLLKSPIFPRHPFS